MTLSLSLAEIKALIAYAREQKVALLEVGEVKFQFHMAAFVDISTPPEDEPRARKAKTADEAPYGHHVPE